jgi:hypothetical protein
MIGVVRSGCRSIGYQRTGCSKTYAMIRAAVLATKILATIHPNATIRRNVKTRRKKSGPSKRIRETMISARIRVHSNLCSIPNSPRCRGSRSC